MKKLYIIMLMAGLSFACSKKAVKKDDTGAASQKKVGPVIEKPIEVIDITPKEGTTEKVTTPVEIPEPPKPPEPKVLTIEEIQSSLADIYFNYNKYDIIDNAKNQLAQNAKYLMDNPNIKVQIEGHCDERGSDEYNLALGEKRAVSARSYLESAGISPNRITWISYGEEKPLDPGHDEASWAKNRRAHFRVVSK